jgi:hypothetical protein
MGIGAATFVVLGLIQGLLGEAHWTKLSNAVFVFAVAGWIVGACGVGLHLFVLIQRLVRTGQAPPR